MSALIRYQAAVLLRSNRWIFPLIAYGALIAVGAASSTPLAEGLDWSAAMLVPVVAFLTRSMLLAEPDASRACVAAAAGPARAQLATLLAALGGGIVLGAVGAVFTLLTSEPVGPHPQPGVDGRITATFHYPGVFLAGLLTAVVCLLVGAAVGALCNPPLLRHPGTAALATLAVVILALASGVSPANAALRHDGTGGSGAASAANAANWPGAISLLAAAALLAITWTASTLAATRRERSLS
jgi:hypothetical protein